MLVCGSCSHKPCSASRLGTGADLELLLLLLRLHSSRCWSAHFKCMRRQTAHAHAGRMCTHGVYAGNALMRDVEDIAQHTQAATGDNNDVHLSSKCFQDKHLLLPILGRSR